MKNMTKSKGVLVHLKDTMAQPRNAKKQAAVKWVATRNNVHLFGQA